MKFVLASNNPKKLTELRDILGTLGIEVISQKEAGIHTNPEENGQSFEENALIKARAACAASGLPAVADDSGLCVDALGGAPGIYSARYGGEGLSDTERYALLLENMRDRADRRAKFVSCAACAFPDGTEITALGECPGEILSAPQGEGGFGYDPVFRMPEFGKSMAEMSAGEKNRVSHRARALNELKHKLESYMRK